MPGCVSGGCAGWPPGLGYFVDLFKNQAQNYIRKLIGRRRPRKILVNMIYYPAQQRGGSWADGALGALCYDRCPNQLQQLIRTVFALATRRIVILGAR